VQASLQVSAGNVAPCEDPAQLRRGPVRLRDRLADRRPRSAEIPARSV